MIADKFLQQGLDKLYASIYATSKPLWVPWMENIQASRNEHTLSYIRPQVNSTAKIIDVGCGNNLYKQYYENLVGVDPVAPAADVKSTIEEFETNQRFDVAFCFGSIVYGTEERIRNQISKVVSLMESQNSIFWRSPQVLFDNKFQIKNPVPPQHYIEYNIFNFTEVKHNQISRDFGYILEDFSFDPQKNSYALAKWVRSTY